MNSNIVQFPHKITIAQAVREYNSCIEAMSNKSERLEAIANRLVELNQETIALNSEAHFIGQELFLIRARMENLNNLITEEENGLQT